jgi:hypothetical protein
VLVKGRDRGESWAALAGPGPRLWYGVELKLLQIGILTVRIRPRQESSWDPSGWMIFGIRKPSDAAQEGSQRRLMFPGATLFLDKLVRICSNCARLGKVAAPFEEPACSYSELKQGVPQSGPPGPWGLGWGGNQSNRRGNSGREAPQWMGPSRRL